MKNDKEDADDEETNIAWFAIARGQSKTMTDYLGRGRQFSSASDGFLETEYVEEIRKWSEMDVPWPKFIRMEDLQSELAIRQIELETPELTQYLKKISDKVLAMFTEKGFPDSSPFLEETIEAYEARTKNSN